MVNKSFLFNVNKCVGCHACVVACTIENHTTPGLEWREITPFNPAGFPDIPLFHFSLACNHCKSAPCMKNCPALAYSMDENTGAILHFAEKCIGCKYCTWACPYDAPKFNPFKGIVEKCTFCNSRIEKSLKPSCANLCPTGALDFIDQPEDLNHKNIPGFTDAKIHPSIKIIPAEKNRPKLLCSEIQTESGMTEMKEPASKISLSHEWPLALFTLLAALMTSWFTSSVIDGLSVSPVLFIISGLAAIILSSFHLGKKARAWRSLLNIKNSWLSREILFFSAFFGSAGIYLLFYQNPFLSGFSILTGIAALFSIDRVYDLALQPVKIKIHSAHVLLTGFLFFSVLSEHYYAFLLIALLKSVLYAYRKFKMNKVNKNPRLLLSGLRIDFLLSFPLIFWIFDFNPIKWLIFTSILLGEMVDRFEYYNELDIITPEKQIYKDYNIE
ncbi:MAG: DmsC/YnfH family molybdoenzyme membrane anchor subunit [Bacteroidales bacterium]